MGKANKNARSATVAAKATDAALVAKGVPSISAAPSTAAPLAASERVATVATDKKSFPLSARIVVVAEGNPKRPGTKAAAKFPLYREAGAGTVEGLIAAFVKAGYPKRRALSALRWDSSHGFIEIEPVAS